MHTPWFGVGLRSQHAAEIDASPRAVDWYEILSDNHLGASGARLGQLARVRAEAPIALHGVSLSIAGSDPLDRSYLDALADLAGALEPAFVSDHLCWTGIGGRTSHDLLPVTYTETVLAHVAERVDAAQESLRRRLFLENASAYVAFREDSLGEAAFFAALCRRTGCGMLLDVNNLFVNAANLGLDPLAYLAAIPLDAVGYLHVAGHAVLPDVRIDTHDSAVPDPVWDLYAEAVRRFPAAPVIVERDDHIPPFAELAAEASDARARHAAALAGAPRGDAPRARAAQHPGPQRSVASWAALQRDFFDRLADKPVGCEQPDAATLFDDARPVRAVRGLRVYSDAYAASLRRALATNFPALARVLAPRDFDALAAAYLRAHPPLGHGFASLGRALAAFVRAWDLAAGYDVAREALADVAALEQAQLEAQAAPDDDDTVRASALAAIAPDDWETLRVRFVRALRIVTASHDVLPALEAVAENETPPQPRAGDVAYLVQRGAIGMRTERVDPAEARVLESLAAGRPFADACRAGAHDGESEAASAERGVRALVIACERGLVAAIDGALSSRPGATSR
jgi:uncharacterized protein (UPF0276 family)